MAITAKQGATYLNETLAKLGYDYQIDLTSDATIEAGFKEVGAFAPSMLDNIVSMQMKILKTRVYNSMFTESKNPMRRFFRDAIEYGGGIQEIYMKLIEAEDGYWAHADMTDTEADEIARDLVSFKEDDVINKIHPVNFKFRIKMSLSDLEISKLFTPNGYADFIGSKYSNFQQSAEAKLQEIGIAKIQEMVKAGKCKFETGLDLSTPNGVTSVVERINTVSDGMSTLCSDYNYDGVKTTTDFDNLYLVVTPKFINRLRSRGYANAYNLEEYKAKNRLIILPANTIIGTDSTGKEIGCLLIDYRAILIAIRYWEVKPFIVSNTDYRNTFMQVQGIVDYNTFFNAVAFVTGDASFFTESDDVIYGVLTYYDSIKGNLDAEYRINGNNITDYIVTRVDESNPALLVVPVNSVLEILDTGSSIYTVMSLKLSDGSTVNVKSPVEDAYIPSLLLSNKIVNIDIQPY